MIDESTLPATTEYADEAAYIAPPDNAQWANGTEPEYTLPAAWWNYFMNLFTRSNVQTVADINSILDEMKAVLTEAGITVNPALSNQLLTALNTTYAKLASPALTGEPTAPTAALGTDTTQLATTAFANAAAIAASGSSGEATKYVGYNFNNGQFETAATGWVTYADAAGIIPIDGTGGAPVSTFIRNTTTPLCGIADGILSKNAVNRQGEGVSYDFTIDKGQLASPAHLTFDYLTTGAFASGDIGIYIIALTGGTIIYPSIVDLPATYGSVSQHLIVFNPLNSSTGYRLCFHIATVNASAWTFEVDNIVVGQKNVAVGAVISNAIELPSSIPVITNLPGSWTRKNYTRSGVCIHLHLTYSVTGAATGALGLSLSTLLATLGLSTTEDTAQIISTYNGSVSFLSGFYNTVSFYSTSAWTTNVPYAAWANGMAIVLDVSYSISQWTSNVNLASDFTEYASSSNTANVTDTDYSNTVLGSQGSLFPVNLTAPRIKWFQFIRPIQPADTIILEMQPNGTDPWLPVQGGVASGCIWSFQVQGTTAYGMGIYGGGVLPTQLKVVFGGYPFADGATFGAPASTGWGTYSTYKWRVRKVSNGNMAEQITQPNTTVTTLYDADTVNLNSSTGLGWVKASLTSLMAKFKTYFDTLYGPRIVSTGTGTIPAGGSESFSIADGYTYLIFGVFSVTGASCASMCRRIGENIWMTELSAATGFTITINTATSPDQVKITNTSAGSASVSLTFSIMGYPS